MFGSNWPGQQLPRLRYSWFYSVLPGKYQNSIYIRPRPLPSKSFLNYRLSIILPVDAV
jgi:hypothetical protein